MDDLLALARAEQEFAKTLLRRRLYGHGITLATAIAALFVDAPGTYVLATAALVSEMIAWALRWYGGERNALAETARRRALLAGTLGRDPDPTGTAALHVNFSNRARKNAENWRDPDYWASELPPGPDRLRESLQESSFWSCRLYRAAGRRALWRLAFFASGLIFIVIVLVVADTGTVAETAARVGTAFLAAAITTDELGVMLTYFAAGREAERTLGRLDNTNMSELGPALTIFGDYSVATAAAAPIPTSVYGREHDDIAEAWAGRQRVRMPRDAPTTRPAGSPATEFRLR